MHVNCCTVSTSQCGHTVCVEHLADIKFGNLRANTGWLTFSLANQPMQLVRYTADYWVAAKLAVILI